jgi:hypothetical protein
MKKTIIALSVAAMASMGMFSIAPSANAASSNHSACRPDQTYNVKKGKCTKTRGATIYGGGHMHKQY